MNTIKKIAYYLILTVASPTPHIPSKATKQEKKLLQYEKAANRKTNKAATRKTKEEEIATAKEAIPLYQKAITIANTEEIKNKEIKLLELHSMKALAHHIARDPKASIQSLQEVASLYLKNPSASIKLAGIYKQIGDRHLETSDPFRLQKASQQYQKAIDILTQPKNQAKDPSLLCYTYGAQAYVLSEQKKYPDAINQYKKILDISQQYPKNTKEINLTDFHYLIARTHFKQENYQKAAQYAQMAYDTEKNKLKKATYATLLSLAHHKMNNKSEAEKYQKKAYKRRKNKLGKNNPLTQQTAQLLDIIQNPPPLIPTKKPSSLTNPTQETQTPPNPTDLLTPQKKTKEIQELPQDDTHHNSLNSLVYTGAATGSIAMLHKWKKTKKAQRKNNLQQSKSAKHTPNKKTPPPTT